MFAYNRRGELERQANVNFFRQIYIIANKGVKEEDLRECFQQFGTIKEIRANAGGHNILFGKTSEACRATEEMHGRLMNGYPKPLKVLLSIPKHELGETVRKDQSQLIRKIEVLVPKGHRQPDVREYFTKFGDLEYVSIVKDRTYNGHQLANICYYRQYHAAVAAETCDKMYKARFITPLEDEQFKNKSGPYTTFHNDKKEVALPYHSYNGQSSNTGSDGFNGAKRQPGDELLTYPHEGFSSLEIHVPVSVTEIQVQRLCAMVPNLIACRIGETAGKLYAHYEFPQCAAFAMDRMANFEFGTGQKLLVKYCLQDGYSSISAPHPPSSYHYGRGDFEAGYGYPGNSMAHMERDPFLDGMGGRDSRSPGKMWSNRREAIDMAADMLSNLSMRDSSSSILPPGYEYVPFCSVPLPRSKFDKSKDSSVRGKVWFMTSSQQVQTAVLMDLALRFGEVYKAYYVREHLFGFIHFNDKSAAQRFVETLNNSMICSLGFKCELAQDDQHGPEKKSKSNASASNSSAEKTSKSSDTSSKANKEEATTSIVVTTKE